ncbi:MAG: hypothetical protein HDT43_05455 [Ruminococcaceae bacterium]|nr:hypothetical protein [Oscillospiraceae bacterium]
MPQNSKRGIYTYFWFEKGNEFEFLKFTIQHCHRVDEKGVTHSDESVKYYVLHEFCEKYPEQYGIPEPSRNSRLIEEPNEGEFHPTIVNSYGRFRYVFDDEETAKKFVSSELLHILYPYLYILSDEDKKEWNKFVDENPFEE